MFQLPDQVPRSDVASGSSKSEPAPGILVECRPSQQRERKPSSPKVKSAPLLSTPLVPPQLAAVVPLQPARPRLAKTPAKPFPGSQFAPMVFSGAVGLVFLFGLTLTSLYFCQAQPIEDTNHQTLTAKIPAPEIIRVREPVLPEPVTATPNPEDAAQKIAPPPPPPKVTEAANASIASLASSVEEIKVAKLDPPKEPLVEKKKDPPAPGIGDSCLGDDKCGTAVMFVASPKLAQVQAAKLKKLVFVLHVSGNFEDPGFT